MMTKQNDTAALTDEQLDAVSGSVRPIPSPGLKSNYVGGFISIEPNPSPYPRPWRTAVRIGFRSIAPLPSP